MGLFRDRDARAAHAIARTAAHYRDRQSTRKLGEQRSISAEPCSCGDSIALGSLHRRSLKTALRITLASFARQRNECCFVYTQPVIRKDGGCTGWEF
jgi:hypothetical protein